LKLFQNKCKNWSFLRRKKMLKKPWKQALSVQKMQLKPINHLYTRQLVPTLISMEDYYHHSTLSSFLSIFKKQQSQLRREE
jgi:hypothetical protein